jgi:hypothetical protein
LFEESLRTLAKPGNGYHRGRTTLARGLALLQFDRSKGLLELNQAVALARRLRCTGLLARALNARAEARLGNA